MINGEREFERLVRGLDYKYSANMQILLIVIDDPGKGYFIADYSGLLSALIHNSKEVLTLAENMSRMLNGKEFQFEPDAKRLANIIEQVIQGEKDADFLTAGFKDARIARLIRMILMEPR